MTRAFERLALLVLVLTGCASSPTARELPPDASPNRAAELNLQLGVGYIRSGHYDVALGKLKKALSFDDSLPGAYNALGVLHEETGEPELAGENYRRALELADDYPLARLNYGRFLCSQNQFEAGLKQFLTAAGSGMDDPARAMVGAAVCARQAGKPDQAEEYLSRARALDPDNPQVLLEQAYLQQVLGNLNQSLELLGRYHQRVAATPASLWLGVRVSRALGDEAARRRFSERLLAGFPASAEARRLMQSE